MVFYFMARTFLLIFLSAKALATPVHHQSQSQFHDLQGGLWKKVDSEKDTAI